ncbi:hypothetical protein MMPV_005809 [Pyropia vietnamensis]
MLRQQSLWEVLPPPPASAAAAAKTAAAAAAATARAGPARYPSSPVPTAGGCGDATPRRPTARTAGGGAASDRRQRSAAVAGQAEAAAAAVTLTAAAGRGAKTAGAAVELGRRRRPLPPTRRRRGPTPGTAAAAAAAVAAIDAAAAAAAKLPVTPPPPRPDPAAHLDRRLRRVPPLGLHPRPAGAAAGGNNDDDAIDSAFDGSPATSYPSTPLPRVRHPPRTLWRHFHARELLGARARWPSAACRQRLSADLLADLRPLPPHRQLSPVGLAAAGGAAVPYASAASLLAAASGWRGHIADVALCAGDSALLAAASGVGAVEVHEPAAAAVAAGGGCSGGSGGGGGVGGGGGDRSRRLALPPGGDSVAVLAWAAVGGGDVLHVGTRTGGVVSVDVATIVPRPGWATPVRGRGRGGVTDLAATGGATLAVVGRGGEVGIHDTRVPSGIARGRLLGSASGSVGMSGVAPLPTSGLGRATAVAAVGAGMGPGGAAAALAVAADGGATALFDVRSLARPLAVVRLPGAVDALLPLEGDPGGGIAWLGAGGAIGVVEWTPGGRLAPGGGKAAHSAVTVLHVDEWEGGGGMGGTPHSALLTDTLVAVGATALGGPSLPPSSGGSRGSRGLPPTVRPRPAVRRAGWGGWEVGVPARAAPGVTVVRVAGGGESDWGGTAVHVPTPVVASAVAFHPADGWAVVGTAGNGLTLLGDHRVLQ